MESLENIHILIREDKLDDALHALNAFIDNEADNAEALFLRGKVLWRKGLRPLATTDYARSAAIDPDGPAAMALEHARDIESFFNPDLLNP